MFGLRLSVRKYYSIYSTIKHYAFDEEEKMVYIKPKFPNQFPNQKDNKATLSLMSISFYWLYRNSPGSIKNFEMVLKFLSSDDLAIIGMQHNNTNEMKTISKYRYGLIQKYLSFIRFRCFFSFFFTCFSCRFWVLTRRKNRFYINKNDHIFSRHTFVNGFGQINTELMKSNLHYLGFWNPAHIMIKLYFEQANP